MSVLTKSLPFPAYFCAHGGGPLPLLNVPTEKFDHTKLVKSWANSIRAITSVCGKPKAIVVISAHYQTQVPSVGSDPAPQMIYDYGGFPAEAYAVKYPAPGSAEVSRRALELLANAGIPAKEDKTRPYDHGVFVPLIKMFPDATIPVVPVSILHSEDPKHHIAMGRALAPLRSEGVLIIGSGLTVHNFHSRGGDGSTFNNKLIEVITSEGLSKEERISALSNFLKWPRAEEAQTAASGTDHFMPLLTAYGAGIDATEDGRGKVAGRLTLSLRERSFDFLELWFGEEEVLSQLKSFEA